MYFWVNGSGLVICQRSKSKDLDLWGNIIWSGHPQQGHTHMHTQNINKQLLLIGRQSLTREFVIGRIFLKHGAFKCRNLTNGGDVVDSAPVLHACQAHEWSSTDTMKTYSHSHQLATLSLLSWSKSQLFILVLTMSRIFWNLPPWAFSADGEKKKNSQKRSTHVCDFQEERRKPGLGNIPGFMPLLTPTMCSWLGRFASDLSLPALWEKRKKKVLPRVLCVRTTPQPTQSPSTTAT